MGDSDFASVPADVLASRAYADRLRPRIRDEATPSEGMPPDRVESEETTHFSVMDGEGCAVACTTTLNGSYGCGVTVRGAGFLLNNEMDDFAASPGVPNMYDLIQGEANAVGPRKRPLSSMTPTLLERDGRVVMVIGSPGGPTIINIVLQCISNVVDHGMDIAEAVAAPRIHHQWLPDVIRHERTAIDPDGLRALEARGHRLDARRGWMGDAHGIYWDPARGVMTAAADPRHGGVALGF
jgi:gamma-glutamyltranspeptidase/glutathione hydrolase